MACARGIAYAVHTRATHTLTRTKHERPCLRPRALVLSLACENPSRADSCMHQQPRTELQAALFATGLKQINVLYAHQATHVWCLTRVPRGTDRTFHMRGW